MRRADRLFQIVQILRNRRLVTAKALAERLEVSERTIYRDIQVLSLSGIPIEGEAGVGYALRHGLDIPPIMFSAAELEALVVGARMVKTWGGTELGRSAQSVLDKVAAVVPAELRDRLDRSKLFALRFSRRDDLDVTMDICREALDAKRVLQIDYRRGDGEFSQRRIRPLGLYFWGNVWSLVGWCELRGDFRNFRLDRIELARVLEETFSEDPGQTLQDFIRQMHCQPQ
ncbi:YafY family protein [Methylomonas sp. UP202]|uniref:helix-turn-helix transcriptional regulator n=1 Tax=Methylomonas sp. UP202 TaxID=3040943 RepID=UPI00247A45CE|nr:YafY family protein [Methylomonas sp. UP202]WGS85738.1 YafY family protein [Methylomonas sp. UP202]